MKKHTVRTSALLILCLLLCSFSLHAIGNTEFNIDPSNNTLDLSQADNPDSPAYYTNTLTPIWNLPGYVGRINYTGKNTVLTFNQDPSSNTPMFYFTHNSLPGVWSEFFLVGKVRGRKNGNDVDVVPGNTVISVNGGTITIPVDSGRFETYSATWVDLAVIRRNRSYPELFRNGSYESNFTVKSDRVAQALPIKIYGNRYVEDPVTAWLSLTPDQVQINLSEALGNNKVEIVEAKMNLAGENYNKNYGVSITFRDNFELENNAFEFRHTVLGNNCTIPFKLHRGNNASQTQVIFPKVPITWDNLSFTTPNVWKLFITGVLLSDVQKSIAGSFKATIRVEITPMDSNVQI